jgi:hypothetical protein
MMAGITEVTAAVVTDTTTVGMADTTVTPM